MTKVFIAGSRRLSRLNAEIRSRLDTILDKGMTILVGDANGADKAVQRYLAERSYSHVLVYCMERHCRNNLGAWTTREVTAPPNARGFAYYSAKDLAMVEDADYGLMLWDGDSRGTMNDIVQMLRRNKPTVVYLAPQKRFATLRKEDEIPQVLAGSAPTKSDQAALDLDFALNPAPGPRARKISA